MSPPDADLDLRITNTTAVLDGIDHYEIVADTAIGISGGALIGYGSSERIIRGRAEQNIPMKVFGVNYQTPPVRFMTLAEKNIKSAQDFAGKKLAISPQSRPLLEALMAHNNVPMDKLSIIPVGIEPSSLATGEAEIYHGFRTNQGVMLERKALNVHYITLADPGYEMYDAPLSAMDETFDKQEDLLVRFLRATIKGWEYNNANPDEVAEITVKKYAQEGMDLEQQRIWAESGTSALLITHSLTEAVFLSDRVLVMSPRPGRIIATVPIDLPRPRSLSVMRESRFFEHLNLVSEALYGAAGDRVA